MPTPAAEIDIDEGLVRRLLRVQHPDLADLSLRVLANGWDNVVLRLGDELLVRLPRRAAAADLIEHEQQVLPTLADLVGGVVRLPVPERIGLPQDDYPWSWSIVPWIEGAPVGLDPQPVAVAEQLGEFVRRLHQPAPADAPHNPVRGTPLQDRDRAVRERLATGRVPHADTVATAWERALVAPGWAQPPVWLHGDLHPFNLVAHDGRLAAVVDFGDVTAGDPATDVATAWLTFGADLEGRRTFLTHVATDDATVERARGWALSIATALVAASDDHPAHHALGVRTIEAVLS
jgi:aminoglycoside phosphotransferase (APT) family kinase protein